MLISEQILTHIHWFNLKDIQDGIFSSLPIEIGFEGKNSKGIEAHYCKQIHSADVIKARAETTGPFIKTTDRIEADALWACQTKDSSSTLAVKTADCLPVLFFIPEQRMIHPVKIAAAHAGWRGLSQGILKKTVESITARPQDAHAFFGPCIGPERFEIGPEVVDAFKVQADFNISSCLKKGERDRWFFDLALYGIYELLHASMKPEQIHVLRSCTYSNQDLWYSYRRNGYEGSNWSWIKKREAYL